MPVLENAVHLRKLLLGMERDIGLDNLTDTEKSVYYAVVDLDTGGSVQSRVIRKHELTNDLSQPTFYRALKALLNKGLLAHEAGTRAGQYRILDDNIASK